MLSTAICIHTPRLLIHGGVRIIIHTQQSPSFHPETRTRFQPLHTRLHVFLVLFCRDLRLVDVERLLKICSISEISEMIPMTSVDLDVLCLGVVIERLIHIKQDLDAPSKFVGTLFHWGPGLQPKGLTGTTSRPVSGAEWSVTTVRGISISRSRQLADRTRL